MKVFKLLLSILFISAMVSCKNETTTTNTKTVSNDKTITVSDFSKSPLFDDAALQDMSYKNGEFNFNVTGQSYALGLQTADAPSKMCANSGKGQHIHLIVDNNPYAAKYVSTFNHEIPDGQHHLLAFLSRSYHESIKTKTAHIAQSINVTNNTITSQEDITESMLFYSRPKGTYVGEDTKKVMLDYYLINPKQGQYVIADINGTKQELKQWKPYFLEGLPMGENTIQLTLVDKDGNKLDVPNNPVSRTFTLKENPEEKM